MNNSFYDLEKKCKKRALKRNIRSIALGATIGVVLVVGVYSFLYKIDFFSQNSDIQTVSLATQKEDDLYTQDAKSDKANLLDEETDEDADEEILEEKIEEEISTEALNIEKEYIISENDEELEDEPIFLEPTISLEKLKESFTQEGKKRDIIKQKNEQKKTVSNKNNTITDRESLFKLSPKLEDALYISHYYYEKKDFSNSLKWAIEGSKIDSKSAKPWIMYAQVKAESGSIDIAIKALQTYLSEYYSQEASLLLEKLKKTRGSKR